MIYYIIEEDGEIYIEQHFKSFNVADIEVDGKMIIGKAYNLKKAEEIMTTI